MSRFLPDSLAGRTIAILVIGLGLFHVWSIWVYQVGTEALLGLGGERGVAERLVSATRALDELAESEREHTAQALSSPDLEIRWSPLDRVEAEASEGDEAVSLRRRLQRLAPELAGERLRFGRADGGGHHHPLIVAVRLGDGTWASFALHDTSPTSAPEHDVLGSLTAMAVGILAVSALLVRSINAPLRTLAAAADRLGTDIEAAGAPETGPREIRRVAKAFNTMQARIRRLLADRTQTLAAVSHDLKTPITRLRLRAEFVPDPDLRATIDDDLAEMERMLDSTLAFLRSESTVEESRTIDIASVLRTLCDDASDAGHDVVLSGTERAPLLCRPLTVKRAFANLVDNAVKYGGRARVRLADTVQGLVITIEDDGPGIPHTERERVFDPFYRVEGSRSRETGGSGLGLTVARTAVRAHGGEIALEDGPVGGLRVVVTLPRTASGG